MTDGNLSEPLSGAIHGQTGCPWCGRMVATFIHPDYGLVLLGHRVTEAHTLETPWCEGGGRPPVKA